MTDPWCCYIWCAMDPINIPQSCWLAYTSTMDPSWVLDRQGTCSPCRYATCRRHGPRRVGSSPSMAPGMNGRGVGIPFNDAVNEMVEDWGLTQEKYGFHQQKYGLNCDLTVTSPTKYGFNQWLNQQKYGDLTTPKIGIKPTKHGLNILKTWDYPPPIKRGWLGIKFVVFHEDLTATPKEIEHEYIGSDRFWGQTRVKSQFMDIHGIDDFAWFCGKLVCKSWGDSYDHPNHVCLFVAFHEQDRRQTGWWLTYPSEKYEFVSWDDEIPNIWK